MTKRQSPQIVVAMDITRNYNTSLNFFLVAGNPTID